MQIITNRSEISLEMAVWLIHDNYDYIDEPNYISATGLMKPIRQIILPGRIPVEEREPLDVEDLISSAMGGALHDSIEKSWLNGRHKLALRKLGYPQHIIDRVLVNPTKEELEAAKDPITIYLEQRSFREIDGYKIGGKFDMVCEGRVTDTKSTSVYKWIKGSGDDDYRLQMSIYRWLNPDKITDDYGRINFIFTDWSKFEANTKDGYPPRRIMHRDIELLSIEETEAWIRDKLKLIEKYKDAPEHLIPECTPEELWMTAPLFKYYADPAKAHQPGARSSKNFDPSKDFNDDPLAAMRAANAHLAEKGKGVIVTVPGKPKRCAYCPAFPICSQKDKYNHD